MDVVLQIFDHYLLDDVYAWALPAVPKDISKAVARASPSAILNLTSNVMGWTGKAAQAAAADERNAVRLLNASSWGRDYWLR
jgi:hypothetical protein